MKKKHRTSIISKLFYWLALLVTLVGFATLFTQRGNFTIPFVSTTLVPFFRQFTVSVEVWDASGRSNILTAEHLVFFTSLGISILLLIAGNMLPKK